MKDWQSSSSPIWTNGWSCVSTISILLVWLSFEVWQYDKWLFIWVSGGINLSSTWNSSCRAQTTFSAPKFGVNKLCSANRSMKPSTSPVIQMWVLVIVSAVLTWLCVLCDIMNQVQATWATASTDMALIIFQMIHAVLCLLYNSAGLTMQEGIKFAYMDCVVHHHTKCAYLWRLQLNR